MKAIALVFALALVLVAVVGCSSDEEQVASGPQADSGTSTATPPPTPIGTGYDYLMVDIGREMPGFAGFSVDDSRNVLEVRSTRPDIDVGALKSAIVSRFPLLDGKTIEVVDVSFDFGELSAWYTDVQNVIFTDARIHDLISTTDVDEARNQIVIGIVNEEARQIAEADIAALSLPPGAVAVEIRPFVIPA